MWTNETNMKPMSILNSMRKGKVALSHSSYERTTYSNGQETSFPSNKAPSYRSAVMLGFLLGYEKIGYNSPCGLTRQISNP